jgi:hypothetical protein
VVCKVPCHDAYYWWGCFELKPNLMVTPFNFSWFLLSLQWMSNFQLVPTTREPTMLLLEQDYHTTLFALKYGIHSNDFSKVM